MNNLASLLLDYRTDKESLDRAYALAEQLKDFEHTAVSGHCGLGSISTR